MSLRYDVVDKAKEYIGYKEGPNNESIFGTWAGCPNQPWCAAFISYITNAVGVSQDIVKKFINCNQGYNWFREKGLTKSNVYRPTPGDIMFMDWDPDNKDGTEHVGFVEKVEGNTITTIEGNRSNMVTRGYYQIGGSNIYGYAIPQYENQCVTEGSGTDTKEDIIETVTVKVKSSLRIRTGPGTNYDIVGALYNNDTANIYEIKNNWGRINKNNWICLDYTTHNKTGNVVTTKYKLGLYVVNTPSGLNVRNRPNTTNGDILKAYPNGTRFDTYKIIGEWAKTPSGWVCLRYCKLVKAY